VFLKAILYYVPRFLDWSREPRSRRHQYYQSTTTSCAEYELLMFRFPLQPFSLVRSHAPERSAGPGPAQPVPLATFGCHTQELQFLENPSRTLPALDPGQFIGLTLSVNNAAPLCGQ